MKYKESYDQKNYKILDFNVYTSLLQKGDRVINKTLAGIELYYIGIIFYTEEGKWK